jgi:hypothetical protein
MALTATEKREIKGVVNGRCELLNETIDDRAKALIEAAEEEIHGEHAEVVGRYRADMKALADRYERLRREVRDTVLAARDDGVEITATRVQDFDFDAEPAVLEERTSDVRKRVQRARRAAKQKVERERLQLVEKVALDGIDSQQASSVLAEVPTLDELMVPTDRVRELLNGNGSH